MRVGRCDADVIYGDVGAACGQACADAASDDAVDDESDVDDEKLSESR